MNNVYKDQNYWLQLISNGNMVEELWQIMIALGHFEGIHSFIFEYLRYHPSIDAFASFVQHIISLDFTWISSERIYFVFVLKGEQIPSAEA